MKLNSKCIKFSLFVGSVIIFYAIIEIFFIIFYPHSGYSITYAPWGWSHRPNTRVTYYQETAQFNLDLRKRHHAIPISYNSKGLREFEYDYKKPKNTFRILILGDSWAEDMRSFFENLHAKWLERKLNSKGYAQKIEVINAGHYAFDDDQEYMYYLKEGRKYSPDIVILMYTGDKAGQDYVSLVNQELVLHCKTFSFPQRLYKEAASLIRRKSHFGSFLLDKITNIREIKKALTDWQFKEKDRVIPKLYPIPGQIGLPYVMPQGVTGGFTNNVAHRGVDFPVVQNQGSDFKELDKAIWLSFDKEVRKDKGVFIFLSCMDSLLNSQQKDFLTKNNILVLGIPPLEGYKLKEDDLKTGTYSKLYDSHRFGYKANEKVADRIIDFLLQNKLLPPR